MNREERAAADARSETTTRLLRERIAHHLERLRVERGLERPPTIEEITAEVEARVAKTTSG